VAELGAHLRRIENASPRKPAIVPTTILRRFSRKRLLVAARFVAIFVAVSALAIGSTLGRSDATSTTRTSALTGGTVTLSNNASGACSATNMLPGNSSSCTLTATYGGSASGYLGLDVVIETQVGT